MTEESFEVFRHDIKRTIQEIAESFTEPDDDWAPVLISQSEDGTTVFGIDGKFLRSYESKHRLVFQLLVPHLQRTGAYRYAMVNSAWMVKTQSEEALAAAARRGSLRDHPDRTETLVLQVVDRERNELWLAPIERSETKPPTLGKWDRMDGGEATGLMIDPLIAALREEPDD